MTQTIAVDFDGVIHSYSRGWKDGSIYGPPVRGAFGSLEYLMKHYAVFIFTSRDCKQVAEWLEDKGGFTTETSVPPDGFWNEKGILLVTMLKLPAVAYIDDRAIEFKNWDDTLKRLF